MPRKLGQHFLKDKKILAQIAREILAPTSRSLPSTLSVIEIGPGHGELTDELLREGAKKIIAIEKDLRLVEQLNSSLVQKAKGGLEIIQGDAREVLPRLVNQSTNQLENYAIVGNIPYYLTGYLLRILGELTTHHQLPITKCVLLIQKEVAERVAAKAPRANLLGSMVQGWAEPHIAFTVPRGAFAPPPNVDSALLTLVPKPETRHNEYKRYTDTVKKLFHHPRKTLTNNLRNGFSLTGDQAQALVHSLHLKESARAAELTPEHIKSLVKMMYN